MSNTARAVVNGSKGVNESEAKSAGVENDNAEAAGDFLDEIAVNRGLPVTPAERIPRVPKGYRPTSGMDRIKRLRRFSDAQMPLAREAARQVMARRDHWKEDLGDLAPDLRPIAAVVADVDACEATITSLRALLAYHEERYDIARGDLEALLRGAHKEFEHRVDRKANLATDYSQLAALFASMSTAIADGIAQAKREKKSDKG